MNLPMPQSPLRYKFVAYFGAYAFFYEKEPLCYKFVAFGRVLGVFAVGYKFFGR
jgi:hypothetical protein